VGLVFFSIQSCPIHNIRIIQYKSSDKCAAFAVLPTVIVGRGTGMNKLAIIPIDKIIEI
jgi:hypothetical protein